MIIAMFGAFANAIIYTEREIMRVTGNAICLSRTAPKQAKTSRLKRFLTIRDGQVAL